MNVKHWNLILPLAAGIAWSVPAMAVPTYDTEGAAMANCNGDEVVFINLDRVRYYHSDQPEYGQARNGVYGCLNSARGAYRLGHSDVITTTTVTRQVVAPGMVPAPALVPGTVVTRTTTVESRP